MPLNDKLPQTEIRLNNKRMSEVISEELTDWIMDGTLDIGQRIREDELADVFGVSRMPVREAIRMLESKGLLETIPYVGTSVRKLSKEEIKEIYLLRMILEPLASEVAATKITDEEIKALEVIQNDLERLCSQPKNLINTKAVYLSNREFHMCMYNACRLEKLLSIINNLWDSIAFLRIRTAYSDSYPAQMKQEHQEYLRLLKNRDGKELSTLLKENLQRHVSKFVNY